MNLPQNRLSDWIVQDLASYLESELEPPFRLTTSAIARHYDSSRTPVNRAIQELIRRGLLQKLNTGRLCRPQIERHATTSAGETPAGETPAGDSQTPSNPAQFEGADQASQALEFGGAGPARVAWERGGWRVEVREQLVQEVVRLSLQGQTAFLRENAWSQRLGIGRGILRPLLSELAGLGFVLHVPRRGWQVHPFSDQDMWQYLEIRELLELKALELAQGQLDSRRLQEMLEGNPTAEGDGVETDPWAGRRPQLAPSRTVLSRADLPPLNNEIHGYLIHQAGNRYIADFFQRHSAYYTQLFQMAAVQTGWRDAMAAQHREILLALLEHDWTRARRALAQHIRAQRPVVQELLLHIRVADNLPIAQQA